MGSRSARTDLSLPRIDLMWASTVLEAFLRLGPDEIHDLLGEKTQPRPRDEKPEDVRFITRSLLGFRRNR